MDCGLAFQLLRAGLRRNGSRSSPCARSAVPIHRILSRRRGREFAAPHPPVAVQKIQFAHELLAEWRDREIINRMRIIKIALFASVVVALLSLAYVYVRAHFLT